MEYNKYWREKINEKKERKRDQMQIVDKQEINNFVYLFVSLAGQCVPKWCGSVLI